MLDAISSLCRTVVGRLTASRIGPDATDLVLTVTRMLREHGVVGKFVEFFGPGVGDLPLADRATLANMAPEYGATCGFFPVDRETLRYLELSGRGRHRVRLVERYARAQGLWQDPDSPEPAFTDVLELDLGAIEPSIAGPKRPQDRVPLRAAKEAMAGLANVSGDPAPVSGTEYALANGSVVIAAITSCTNTSNPSAMVAAGLLAKAARKRGLERKPWVKTSLAPGSQVVTDYLDAAHLTKPLNELGFHLVGYGCTTCIGNSGPLDPAIVEAIERGEGLTVSAPVGNQLEDAYPILGQWASPLCRAIGADRSILISHGSRNDPEAIRHPRIWQTMQTPGNHREIAEARDVSTPVRRSLRGFRGVANDCGQRRADLPLARRVHVCAAAAVL